MGGGKKAQTSSQKTCNSRDLMTSLVITVNSTVSHI